MYNQTKGFSINYNGFNYLVIHGKYVNGGFFCIVNHGVSGDMSDSGDTFYNSERIGHALNDYETGKVITEAIKNYEFRSQI